VRTDPRYKSYLLVLLTAIATFNYLDRVVLGIVLQDVKTDLDLTDTQLGFLTGIAFALFYSVMGIPLARWADRGNRVSLITLTTGLWTLAVALCGAAASFMQLLLIRIGVAVGEAGCIPPAHSLIAEYYTRAERPRAVSIYMLAFPLALTFGNVAAGWLNELHGWRATFVVLSLPGFALAALAAFTLKEPRRSRVDLQPRTLSPAAVQSFREVCATLWANAAFRHLLVCFSVWYFFGYGILQWTPTFFIRSHGLQTGELGTWFALIYGVGGGVGTYLGGALAARYAARNERRQLIVCGASFSVFAVLATYAFLAPNPVLAFTALGLGALGGNMALGPILATMQTLVPARMRAMSIALVYLFANLIGMGLGPLAAGALSDALRPWFAEESLRYALVMLCPGYFWAGIHLWRASRTVDRDLESAQLMDAAA
jgi:MFS family permease